MNPTGGRPEGTDHDRESDPVVARREQVRTIVNLSKRVGYLALSVAIGAFIVGAIAGFSRWTVTLSALGLVVSCVVLPVPIVLGYGIRKAEREDPVGPPPGPSTRGRG